MTQEKFEKWCEKNQDKNTEIIRKSSNGADWVIVKMNTDNNNDGWYAVFRIHPITHNYIPEIQTKTEGHANSFIYFTELVNVAVDIWERKENKNGRQNNSL